ncbi:hypothetical protein GC105_07815 [Alkalibaculum sp. M08DMB]|uniref:B12-binding N-terminal domain-containing protein n=1 Tax=Alkalibaculum sporogenes TaxID=2655001 RepID=A0A6A7K8K3_9FIRM|nr:B12-binding domain-containing protein [Alkalibaculum sporogenes]MPW25695.1 hypothetical protein [Alkalibaculum sporogenes]
MIDYEGFSKALGKLHEEEALRLAHEFINSDPNEEEEKLFMKAAQNGIDTVAEQFEMRKYSVGELIYAKEILSQIMDMILPKMHAVES